MQHPGYTISRHSAGASVFRQGNGLTGGMNHRMLLRLAIVLALSCLCWVGIGCFVFGMYRLVAQ